MGRVAPNPDNVLRDFQNIPKFGKLAKDERARVLAFEFGAPEPGQAYGSYAEYVHNLTVPAIEETRPDGSKVEVVERNWIGNFICLGREEVLAEQGADPETCPVCAHAHEDESFKPTRRHATNLVIYATKAGTFDLREPWMVDLKPWVFSERTFRAIVDLHKTWGDLRQHDLLITCTNPRFQNYEIQPAPDAAWLTPENNPEGGQQLKLIVSQVVKANKLDDEALASLLGTRLGRASLVEKVTTYRRELEAHIARVSGAPAPSSQPMAATDINDMLGGQPTGTTPAGEAPAAPETTPNGAPTAPPAAPPAAEQPAPETPAPPPPAQPVSTGSIDDLLS